MDDFFGEVVEDALRHRRVAATDTAKGYLVGLLVDHARRRDPEGTPERPFTFQLDEALHAPTPGERFERLRTLGDGILYGCGFFAEHYEARGVDAGYLISIGTTAYGSASDLLRRRDSSASLQSTDVFGELAGKFARFVDVLMEVADATVAAGAASSRNVLKVYERYMRRGGERLAEALGAQGLAPVGRGVKGIAC
jgi:hypothetical protein